jgi:hypothetical protein
MIQLYSFEKQLHHILPPVRKSFPVCLHLIGHLYDLMVRFPGYRPRGPGFDLRRYQIFGEVVGLERSILDEKLRLRSKKPRLTAVRTRRRDHVTILYPQMLEL